MMRRTSGFPTLMNQNVDAMLRSILDTTAGVAAQSSRPGTPAFNVWEDEAGVTIEAELPGYAMENIEISALGREVTISGERKIELPSDAVVHRRDRASEKFSRGFRFAFDVETQAATASLEHGVLTVRLPKTPKAQPRKIAVTGG